MIAATNNSKIQQEHYQSLQENRDLLTAYRKASKRIIVRVSENDKANMLQRMRIDHPTENKRQNARKMAILEHHAILFLLGADKYN